MRRAWRRRLAGPLSGAGLTSTSIAERPNAPTVPHQPPWRRRCRTESMRRATKRRSRSLLPSVASASAASAASALCTASSLSRRAAAASALAAPAAQSLSNAARRALASSSLAAAAAAAARLAASSACPAAAACNFGRAAPVMGRRLARPRRAQGKVAQLGASLAGKLHS